VLEGVASPTSFFALLPRELVLYLLQRHFLVTPRALALLFVNAANASLVKNTRVNLLIELNRANAIPEEWAQASDQYCNITDDNCEFNVRFRHGDGISWYKADSESFPLQQLHQRIVSKENYEARCMFRGFVYYCLLSHS
jgi:hypothetical protein